jgi:hypothetical protein
MTTVRPPGQKALARVSAAGVTTPICRACSAEPISKATARSGGRRFTWNSRSMPPGVSSRTAIP